MAQSSNYKSYNRQIRTLTEEADFSGGMLWTDNNISGQHLKTIINFNYDESTGFLKTRNTLKPINVPNGDGTYSPLMFKIGSPPEWYPVDPTDPITYNEYVEGLYNKQFIGAYNICYTDTTGTKYDLAEAGWLYLFGDVEYDGDCYTCLERSLVWLYLDYNGEWYNLNIPEGQLNNTRALKGATGIKPILYDNTLYCTNNSTSVSFYAYRIFKTAKASGSGAAYTPANLTVHRQDWGHKYPEEAKSLFEEDHKDLVYSVTLLEATVTGFNGLRGSNTYTYTSSEGDGTKRITGAYLKDNKKEICVAPRVGQKVSLHVILEYVPKSSKGKIILSRLIQGKASDANAVWKKLKTCDASTNVVFKDIIMTEESETYNITWVSGTGEDAEQYDGLIYNCTTNRLNSNLRLKTYALYTAKGACVWNRHLVLWGVSGAPNSLFISETENFYYMPIPNNVSLFETDIISCIPYLGDLLVFTADRIYRLTENNEGGFVQTVVQNDMPLAKEDAPYLRAIKNMVFFKSGKYYYMLVPKSQSLTGELTVAPIYKNLTGWFDNPATAMRSILTQLYPENMYVENSVTVSNPVDIYTEQDTITILYDVTVKNCQTLEKTSGVLGYAYRQTLPFTQSFALFVNYNTNLRAWTMYLEDTSEVKIYPATLTEARVMSFVCVDSEERMWISTMQEPDSAEDSVRCLIDTGYRTLTNTFKKRFREIQLKLYSPLEDTSSFGSAFFIDGVTRRSYTHLEEVLSATNLHYINLAPVYDPNTFVIEPTVSITEAGNTAISDTTINDMSQGSDSIALSSWTLDFSHFKRGAPSTVRIPVSGKGYAPRFIFMSPKCSALHLNEINWVYRIMNGR